MSMTHLNNKPLVNAWTKAHSTLTLVDVSDQSGKLIKLKGAKIGPVKDKDHGGEWKVHRSLAGDQDKQLRLILVTSTVPHRDKDAKDVPDKDRVPPPDGTLTITITPMGGAATDTTVDTDYANDAPP